MSKNTETYWIGLEEGRYPLHIGAGLNQVALWEPYLRSQLCIVTDTQIAPYHLERWLSFFKQLGVAQVDALVLSAGETTKTLESAQSLWDALLEKGHHRDTLLIALGGGVIGDLTGFVAATYLRGVQFIQLPTSLLAQVDAAIGGKCGVNHLLGKNLIGVLHQPQAIFLDTLHLETLPARQYAEGLAEVVKYGLAFDRCFFHWLEVHQSNISMRCSEELMTLLKWCCQCKVRIITKDISDCGERLLLNFGHTLGHAIEATAHYQGYCHGEAVALGMLAATWLSCQRGLKAFKLPTTLSTAVSFSELSLYLKQDKKQTAQGLRWVLLSELGQCLLLQDVQTAEIEAAVRFLQMDSAMRIQEIEPL
jgi:3-dehydroquinate synthase